MPFGTRRRRAAAPSLRRRRAILYVQMVTCWQLPLLAPSAEPPRLQAPGPASGPEPDASATPPANNRGRRLVQLTLLERDQGSEAPVVACGQHVRPRVDPHPDRHPAAAAVAAFRQQVSLTSVDPARNRARFYLLAWQPGLWGGGALVRTWGRIGAPGRSVAAVYDDREAAQALIAGLLRRRFRHGYRVVAWE